MRKPAMAGLALRREAELFLIESASFRGNSSAPVFFLVPGDGHRTGVKDRGWAIKLGGVWIGYFGEVEPVGPAANGNRPLATCNTGISAAVPAYKLHEILFGEELRKQRNE